MALIAPITINDGESTPVAHTFNPYGGSGANYQQFVYSDGTPLFDKRLSIAIKTDRKFLRPTLNLHVPIGATETINGIGRPLVLRNNYLEIRGSFDPSSSEQELLNLWTFGENLFANQLVRDVFVGRERMSAA